MKGKQTPDHHASSPSSLKRSLSIKSLTQSVGFGTRPSLPRTPASIPEDTFADSPPVAAEPPSLPPLDFARTSAAAADMNGHGGADARHQHGDSDHDGGGDFFPTTEVFAAVSARYPLSHSSADEPAAGPPDPLSPTLNFRPRLDAATGALPSPGIMTNGFEVSTYASVDPHPESNSDADTTGGVTVDVDMADAVSPGRGRRGRSHGREEDVGGVHAGSSDEESASSYDTAPLAETAAAPAPAPAAAPRPPAPPLLRSHTAQTLGRSGSVRTPSPATVTLGAPTLTRTLTLLERRQAKQQQQQQERESGSGGTPSPVPMTLRRMATLNRIERSNSDPSLVPPVPKPASSIASTLARSLSLRRTASADNVHAGGNDSGSESDSDKPRTLDRAGFSALRELVDSVTKPEAAGSDLVITTTAASTIDRGGTPASRADTPVEHAVVVPVDIEAPNGVAPSIEGADAYHDHESPVHPEDDAPAGHVGAVVITRDQWQTLAPGLRNQASHVQELLGVHAVESDPDLVELDLDTFLPLISLLAPAASGAGADGDDVNAALVHEQKLAVLYRILDAAGDGDVTRAVVENVLRGAVKANALYLRPDDMELLVTSVMDKLDVDSDGVVSFHDFLLVTRRWNLAKIGLPLTRTTVNKEVDITDQDHLGLAFPVTPTAARFSMGGAGGFMSPKADGDTARARGLRRKSTVRDAAGWLLRRGSRIQFDVDDLQAHSHAARPGAPGPGDQPKPRDLGLMRATTGATMATASVVARGADDDGVPPVTWQRWIYTLWLSEGPKWMCVAFFALVVGGMFAYNFHKYASNPVVVAKFGYWVPVAKGCANIVNTTGVFLFLLVCRTLLTALRDVKFLAWVPINKNIVWHKYTGVIFIVAGLVHTLCHCVKTIPVLVNDAAARKALGLPDLGYVDLHLRSVPGWTGWALVVVFLAMAATSGSATRRAHFERFWYTHHLFTVGVVLLLLHGSSALLAPPSTWKYISVPVFAYTVERLLRVHRASYKVRVREAVVQADTLVLVLDKPPFVSKYVAGQYIFLNVPSVSNLEWHPFSLTSCGSDPFLTLRIKRAGDWTSAVFKAVEPMLEGSGGADDAVAGGGKGGIELTAMVRALNGGVSGAGDKDATRASTASCGDEMDTDRSPSLSVAESEATSPAAPTAPTLPAANANNGISISWPRRPDPTVAARPSAFAGSLMSSLGSRTGTGAAAPQPAPGATDLARNASMDSVRHHTSIDVGMTPTSLNFMKSYLSLGSMVEGADDTMVNSTTGPYPVTGSATASVAPPRPVLEVRIDGIFGAPSQSFFEHDHVMFIATGVGCTPFLSILQEVQHMVRASQARRRRTTVFAGAPGSGVASSRASSVVADPKPLKRIDFYWLNRDQDGFKWMSEALRSVDPAVLRVLRVHTFLTCAKGGDELASFMLWWGLELAKRRAGGRCLLTGMHQNSAVTWGRPHWASIFAQTAALYPGKKVGVYFCGLKALGKELGHVVRATNAATTTFFEFAKENF
ncbi:hypothetical protein H9P43_002424 [Blastocladiella emersonii ATCC 22665]|nr:hypothetical protein H9P43_002424 [Blastocladiella emersonii ATCC 22665]